MSEFVCTYLTPLGVVYKPSIGSSNIFRIFERFILNISTPPMCSRNSECFDELQFYIYMPNSSTILRNSFRTTIKLKGESKIFRKFLNCTYVLLHEGVDMKESFNNDIFENRNTAHYQNLHLF